MNNSIEQSGRQQTKRNTLATNEQYSIKRWLIIAGILHSDCIADIPVAASVRVGVPVFT